MANLFPAASREDLSVAWINTTSVDAQAQGIAPDGTNTLNTATDNNDAGSGSAFMRFDINHPTHDQHCFAIFAKANGAPQLSIQNVAYNNQDSSGFDLVSGSLEAIGPNHDNAIIQPYGGGIYRCAIVFTTTTDLSGHYRLYIANSLPSVTLTRDGSNSLILWGASLNTGAEPEPYESQDGVIVVPNLGRSSSAGLSFGKMGHMGLLK